jgi:hypothetical protein
MIMSLEEPLRMPPPSLRVVPEGKGNTMDRVRGDIDIDIAVLSSPTSTPYSDRKDFDCKTRDTASGCIKLSVRQTLASSDKKFICDSIAVSTASILVLSIIW